MPNKKNSIVSKSTPKTPVTKDTNASLKTPKSGKLETTRMHGPTQY